MTRSKFASVTLVAAAGWLAVAGYGVWSAVNEQAGEGWELPYFVFSLGLLVGAALVAVVLGVVSRGAHRPRLRRVGMAALVVAAVFSLVAWAIPIWMGALGLGSALVAVSGSGRWRRAVAALAAAQVVGVVVLIGGIEAEIGRRDSYGDYPVAGALAILVTSGAVILSLLALSRLYEPAPRQIHPGYPMGADRAG